MNRCASDGTFSVARLIVASLVAAGAFLLYRGTLLPGFDFGDTGSFQVMARSPVITPRDAYPLYFAIGDALSLVMGGDPARALNLASAIEAAVACGLLVLVAAELSGSTFAGAAASMLFAVSYTFWSQAIIAEVYALHILCVAITLLLLLRWSCRPCDTRLALFFVAYALSFGNHLSMILLLPAYALFLMLAAPQIWRDLLNVRVLILAATIAFAGSLQYLWNLRSLWLAPTPPPTILAGLNAFWFDVTKVDWRSTTILGVPPQMLGDRFQMYGFDLAQQFGYAGPALAAVGLLALSWHSPRRAVLVVLAFGVNLLFAFSYNVGDSHVFFLSSHFMVALFIACGTAWCGRAASAASGAKTEWTHRAAAIGVLVLAGWRAWHDYPALDRSEDRRPAGVLSAITIGLDDRRDILLADLNWQQENGLNYFSKFIDRDLAWRRAADVSDYLPALIRDNLAIGRAVALTERAKANIPDESLSPFAVTRDARVPTQGVADVARDLPHGTRYVFCILRPSRDLTLDVDEVRRTLNVLTGGTTPLPTGDYTAVAGLTGTSPIFVQSSEVPFRRTLALGGVDVEVRMESWLDFDTIRRMGFGQVVAAHRHALIVERGVSFVALDAGGTVLKTAYAGNIFAPQARFVVRSR